MGTNHKLNSMLSNSKQNSKVRKFRLLVLAFVVMASFNAIGQNTYRNVYDQKLDQLEEVADVYMDFVLEITNGDFPSMNEINIAEYDIENASEAIQEKFIAFSSLYDEEMIDKNTNDLLSACVEGKLSESQAKRLFAVVAIMNFE